MRIFRRQNSEFRNRETAGGSQQKITLFIVMLIIVQGLLFAGVASAMPIGEILRQHLKENYPWADVEVTDIALSADPSGQMPDRITVQKGLPNRTVFALDYNNDKRITATATVKAFDKVVMTRGAFRKGYALQKEDVYETLMDITRMPKDVVRDSEQILGTALTRSVTANMPVVAGMLNGAQKVKKGQRVMIIASSPCFSISTRGELKETADVGNEVRVQNIDSKKVVTGRLIDENTVKVVF
jgi:flagella basal body P-ring formation protein FlgA